MVSTARTHTRTNSRDVNTVVDGLEEDDAHCVEAMREPSLLIVAAMVDRGVLLSVQLSLCQ